MSRKTIYRASAGGLLLLTLTVPFGTTAWAGPMEADRALDFARALFEAGDLYRAMTEAKRFLFFNPRDPRAFEAEGLLERARALLKARQAGTGPKPFAPWALSNKPAAAAQPARTGSPGTGLIRFYQKRLRTFRRPGAHCPSYPNCSEYAVQAVEKYGLLLGVFITVDRLWREVTTAGTPPQVRRGRRWLHYDPLEHNDYWLAVGREEQ